EDAGVRPAVGPGVCGTLSGDGSEAPAPPVRRPGELSRADRAAARKQRLPDPARDAVGDAVERSPSQGRTASGVERGPRAPQGMGPAVVAPCPADPRLRDRPAG